MTLSPLEADFIGDLAQDEHELYEVFHFIRLHHPSADDDEVLQRGRALVATWLDRGWLVLSNPQDIRAGVDPSDLLSVIDQRGLSVTRAFAGAPRLSLAPKAYDDVPWLRSRSER